VDLFFCGHTVHDMKLRASATWPSSLAVIFTLFLSADMSAGVSGVTTLSADNDGPCGTALTWQDAEELVKDKSEWRRCVAQYIFDAVRSKYTSDSSIIID